MMKNVGIIKRVLCISLVFLLNINALAAVVSDNDGSAFITKAEFDSLKNNFQAQIDNYNHSIDSKIDGAIAQYLAGITVQSNIPVEPLTKTIKILELEDYGDSLECFGYRVLNGFYYMAGSSRWGSNTDNFYTIATLWTYRYPYINATGYDYLTRNKGYMMDYEKVDGTFFFKGINYYDGDKYQSVVVTKDNSGGVTSTTLYNMLLNVPTKEKWVLDTDTGLVTVTFTCVSYKLTDKTALPATHTWNTSGVTGTGYTTYKLAVTSGFLSLNAANAVLAENNTTKNYFAYKFYQVNQNKVPYLPNITTNWKYQQSKTPSLTITKTGESCMDGNSKTLSSSVSTFEPSPSGFWYDPSLRKTIKSQYSYYNYKLSGEKIYTYGGLLLVKNLSATGKLNIKIKGSGKLYFKKEAFNDVATNNDTNLVPITLPSGATANSVTLTADYQTITLPVTQDDKIFVKSTEAANATIDSMIIVTE